MLKDNAYCILARFEEINYMQLLLYNNIHAILHNKIIFYDCSARARACVYV